MFFIKNNLAYMSCVNLLDKGKCIQMIGNSFFQSEASILSLYELALKFPKFIIQSTTEHRIQLYRDYSEIVVKFKDIEQFKENLQKYTDNYYIVADYYYFADIGYYEIVLYKLEDFIYKSKIDADLRKFIITDLLKEI